eukprot:1179664-Prorocentrum_minimum.AAC.1
MEGEAVWGHWKTVVSRSCVLIPPYAGYIPPPLLRLVLAPGSRVVRDRARHGHMSVLRKELTGELNS